LIYNELRLFIEVSTDAGVSPFTSRQPTNENKLPFQIVTLVNPKALQNESGRPTADNIQSKIYELLRHTLWLMAIANGKATREGCPSGTPYNRGL
jgi:hypothetical protein